MANCRRTRGALASTRLVVAVVAVHFSGAAALSEETLADRAQSLVRLIELQHGVDGAWSVVPLIEQPVLRYEERSRDNSGGSVWLWGGNGRPTAILELYQPAQASGDWFFVVSNLSGGALRAFRDGAVWWQENESAVEMTPFPAAPQPASRSAARLLQMRSLARRFQAHEFWDPDRSRFNLRLLPQPLHRFADEDQGTLDGTLFVFVNGTNPEACLLIEARNDESGDPGWHYGLARQGHAEIHVHLDGESVWQVERMDDTPNAEPYWLWHASFPVEADADGTTR